MRPDTPELDGLTKIMKIKTDGKELLDSDTFFAIGLGETTIRIGDSNETVSVVLNFEQDGDKKPSVKWDVIDPETLKATLKNWDNPLGTSPVEPVEVGVFKNRQLFVYFVVRKAGKRQIRQVTFSVYLGEEVQVGQD